MSTNTKGKVATGIFFYLQNIAEVSRILCLMSTSKSHKLQHRLRKRNQVKIPNLSKAFLSDKIIESFKFTHESPPVCILIESNKYFFLFLIYNKNSLQSIFPTRFRYSSCVVFIASQRKNKMRTKEALLWKLYHDFFHYLRFMNAIHQKSNELSLRGRKKKRVIIREH